MNAQLITTNMPGEIVPVISVAELGKAANAAAAQGTFRRELSGKSQNTLASYKADLQTWSAYLVDAGANIADCDWYNDPACWAGVTHGLVLGFREWMIKQGFAIASINRKLSCVRSFCSMAGQAGIISPGELGLIQTAKTIRRGAGIEIDGKREHTRVGRPQAKKAKSVELTLEQAKVLKTQPDTPQGRRDALLMCLLLDHGLRAGEVAALMLTNFNIKRGMMTFWRDKVKKEQTHKLTADTLRALRTYVDAGDAPALEPILRSSRKSGELDKAGMSEWSITNRVKELGERIGVKGLSAHDCRHFWATDAQRNGTDPFVLKEAGGWSSMQTVQRYIDAAKVANEGVKLSA